MTRAAVLRALLLALACAAAAPTTAAAEFGIAPGSLSVSLTDSGGQPELRAGAHPDLLKLSMGFNAGEGNAKDTVIDLPPGLIGNLPAVPRCTREQFAISSGSLKCPPETQVGQLTLVAVGLGDVAAPIYNIEPGPTNVAEFGYRVITVSGRIFARVGADGQTLRLEMPDQGQDLQVNGMRFELWGVPIDHQTGVVGPRRPFLTTPTRCDGGPLETWVRMHSWQQQGAWRDVAATIPAPVGCDGLLFDPHFDVRLDSTSTDTPTGVKIDVTLPQNDDPAGQSAARVRTVEMLLPEGLALSPGGASALDACSDQAAALDSAAASACPATSRLGTVELSSPSLDAPLAGTLHIGRQLTATEYRIFVIAGGPGIDVKRPGTLSVDPGSGRLTARVTDLPEMPFDRISMTFDGGPRAPLVTSLTCGAGATSATLTPYGGGAAPTSASQVTVDSGTGGRPCAEPPFTPSFVAGVSPARAARDSHFEMTIRRPDGDRPIDRFTTTLPLGVGARLASVARCSNAAAESASCPAGSRIGTVAAEAGAGSSPLVLDGDVFLTGPYHGAPFGLALRFPGRIGPFDVGPILVRAALRIDRLTGQVIVASDRLPRIVDGVPLRLQTLALDIDRPGFIVNPTSCAATQVAAVVTSTERQTVRRSTRFAVSGCRSLPFKPRLAAALTDRDELHADGRPGLSLKVDAGPRGANMGAADFVLPTLLGQSPSGVTAICSREQARDGRCPSGSRVGRASARTPLLKGRLAGPIHVVQPAGNGLPDVWVSLSGQGVALVLRMRTIAQGGALRAKFVDLPDFPLATLALRFDSGKHGIFVAERSPCPRGRPRKMVVRATMKGQNGAVRRSRPPLRAACARQR